MIYRLPSYSHHEQLSSQHAKLTV